MGDQRLILELAQQYATTTGQPVRPSYSNPRVHRYGTLISWSYWDFGVIGFVPEYWGGFGRDFDSDGSVTELERLRWNDEVLDGSGFADWSTYEHPQLGAVEVGGWRARFTNRNPPPQLLLGEIEKYVPWMLWLAEIGPHITIRDINVTRVRDEVVKLNMAVENVGYLSTNITQRALDVQVAVPVRAMVELTDVELLSGSARTDLGHLAGSRDTQGITGRAESTRNLEYVFRISGSRPSVIVTVASEKGGVVRKTVSLSGT